MLITIIFIASIVIWFLKSFSFSLNLVADSSQSILAAISGIIAPVFSPWGCGDWRIVTSLIPEFMAKEGMASSLEILFGGTGISSVITPGAGAALLIFCLLYTPCVAAIAAIKRELGIKSALWVVFFQCALGWALASITYLIF